MCSESTDRCASAISRSRRIVSRALDVVEEGKHGVSLDVVKPKATDRTTKPVGEKHEEQPQCLSVCARGVPTCTSNATQMIGKVRLDALKQGDLLRACHRDLLRRDRCRSKRRPAIASNSGVAVK